MKKIEATIRSSKLEEVKESLLAHGVEGMTISEVQGSGHQKGPTMAYRGTERTLDYVPRVKLETVVADWEVEDVVDAIRESAYTGEVGDGRICVTEILSMIRIRTGETVGAEETAAVGSRRRLARQPAALGRS